MNSDERVVVVGAGAAGLSVAGALKRREIDSLLLEREQEIALPWQNRYDSLRLNTPRRFSYLPGYHMPRRYGRWPGRSDIVEYLREYRRRLGLRVEPGIAVHRIDRDGPAWLVRTSGGEIRAGCVVIGTGHDAYPVIPPWPGKEEFKGELLHSADYREPGPFRGRDVLVVSASNSGSEIAYELSRGQAARVRVAMRTSPPITSREYLGFPMIYSALPIDPLPDWVGDFASRRVQRIIYRDLSAYGLTRAPYGIQTQLRSRHHSVLFDSGFVAALKRREIEIVSAVAALEGADVVLADGTRLQPDVVIAATGFKTNLGELVGHLDVLDEQGYPVVAHGTDSPAARGLFFNGYRASMIGQIPHMRRDARVIAKKIARRLES